MYEVEDGSIVNIVSSGRLFVVLSLKYDYVLALIQKLVTIFLRIGF